MGYFKPDNNLTIVGRLTRDAEITTLNSGLQLTKFSVAVEKSANKGLESAYFDCAHIGEKFGVAPYLLKGTQLMVVASVEQTRKEVEGKKVTYTNYSVVSVKLLASNKSSSEGAPLAPAPKAATPKPVIVKEDDLPF
jgi:single-strand DNA-binding protein